MAYVFRAPIVAPFSFSLFVSGRHVPIAPKTTYSIICPDFGRLYGICWNSGRHTNRDSTSVGRNHKHRWCEADAGWAYEPKDITALASEPHKLWAEFCTEFRLRHDDGMGAVPQSLGVTEL